MPFPLGKKPRSDESWFIGLASEKVWEVLGSRLTLYLGGRLKLKDFQKFDSAATALEEVSALVEGKVTPRLASLLDSIKDEKKVSLAVADPKLGMPLISTHIEGISI